MANILVLSVKDFNVNESLLTPMVFAIFMKSLTTNEMIEPANIPALIGFTFEGLDIINVISRFFLSILHIWAYAILLTFTAHEISILA